MGFDEMGGAKKGIPTRMLNGVLPIAVVVISAVIGMYVDGRSSIINSSDGTQSAGY